MFNPFPKAIATEAHESKPVSTEEISIPLEWVTGGGLTALIALIGFVWWMGKLAAKVDKSAGMVEDFEAKLERERTEDKAHRKELKEDLQSAFRRDIADSANNITNELKLFAVEIRQNIRNLSEKLEGRDATVNRLGKKVDHFGSQMIDMAQQLNSSGVPVHYRRGYDNGPPSQPHNYDED
jgi:hypothetical protein